MSIPILKSRIKEMKEGLEKVDNLEPSMNNLHQRIFELKMSLTDVDEEIQKINVLSKRNNSLLKIQLNAMNTLSDNDDYCSNKPRW